MFWNRLRKMEPGAQVLGAALCVVLLGAGCGSRTTDSGNASSEGVDQAALEFQQFRQHASKATGIVVPG